MKRHSFTLIEVLVAIALMAIVASGIALGINRSVQASHAKTSKERIERMLLQSFRFAAVSGHVADVVIVQKEGENFEGYINLWETDSKNLSILAQNCKSIGALSGIQSIDLNDRSINKAVFRFFGCHGLCAVHAYDGSERELAPAEFGFSPEAAGQKNTDLEIRLRTKENQDPFAKISLQPYLLSVPRHLPFPDEYLLVNSG
jgi:prepilin-type N-terminal cleavage/methylation domain-containing protein